MYYGAYSGVQPEDFRTSFLQKKDKNNLKTKAANYVNKITKFLLILRGAKATANAQKIHIYLFMHISILLFLVFGCFLAEFATSIHSRGVAAGARVVEFDTCRFFFWLFYCCLETRYMLLIISYIYAYIYILVSAAK